MASSHRKTITVGRDRVSYRYNPGTYTEELFALYQALDAHGIGPKVLSKDKTTITVEKLDLLTPGHSDGNNTLNPKLIAWFESNGEEKPKKVIKAAISKVMHILHDAIGYCHADAHPGNMGYRLPEEAGGDLKIILFDLDEAFPISIGRYMPSVLNWIETMYDDMSYADIIQYDFENAIYMIDF
jgi:hypothetical protein